MILDQFKLTGKVAIVTGVATGLGKAMAIGLAEAGADIVGVYNSHTPEDVQQKIEVIGQKFLGIKANLVTSEPISEIIEQTITRWTLDEAARKISTIFTTRYINNSPSKSRTFS